MRWIGQKSEVPGNALESLVVRPKLSWGLHDDEGCNQVRVHKADTKSVELLYFDELANLVELRDGKLGEKFKRCQCQIPVAEPAEGQFRDDVWVHGHSFCIEQSQDLPVGTLKMIDPDVGVDQDQ